MSAKTNDPAWQSLYRASIVTFANDASLVVAPSLAVILMPLNGLLWLVWWLLTSRGLLRLASEVRNTM